MRNDILQQAKAICSSMDAAAIVPQYIPLRFQRVGFCVMALIAHPTFAIVL